MSYDDIRADNTQAVCSGGRDQAPTVESWELARLRAAFPLRHHPDPARRSYQRDAIRKAIRKLREIRGT